MSTSQLEGFRIWSRWSGWLYIVRGTTLYQYDADGKLRATDEYPTTVEAETAAASYATY